MTEKKMPPVPPPVGLADRGAAFWRSVHATWLLNVDESELLTEVCHTLDTVEALQLVINRDGVTATGSMGQVKTHPALAELRGSRLLLSRLLSSLALPDPTGAAVQSASTLRARRAARARWGAPDASTA